MVVFGSRGVESELLAWILTLQLGPLCSRLQPSLDVCPANHFFFLINNTLWNGLIKSFLSN